MNYISFLAPLIDEFIKFRTASMRWCDTYRLNLHSFDKHIVKHHPHATILTNDIVDEWCRKKPTETRNSCRTRIYCVVGLVRYLNQWHGANLAEVEVPRREPRKYIPHAHTDEELHRFFAECDQPYIKKPMPDANRQNLIVAVIFRLFYSTGMRPFEVRMLKRADVCLDSGVVGIEVSKGYDQRYIVLHDTMLELMLQYDKVISKVCQDRSCFFPGEDDSFIAPEWLNTAFRKLWDKTNSAKCRLYDFRHNYAIQNINTWLSAGMSYHSKLVYLSKSMGHRDIEGTCYYYALTPAMAEIQEQKAGQSFNELIPEVRNEKNL